MGRISVVFLTLSTVVVAVSLAGCGTPGASSGSQTGTANKPGAASTPSPSTTTVAVTPSASAAAQNPTHPPSPTHALPAATAANEANYEVPSFGAKGPAFDSPSLNLQCGILDFGASGGYWGCQATQHTWTFASTSPGDPCYQSEISCGHGIEAALGGPVGVMIAGDIQFPGGDPSDYPTKVLPYGKSVTYDGVTCASESDGVTCIEASSGHGFFISKVANDIF